MLDVTADELLLRRAVPAHPDEAEDLRRRSRARQVHEGAAARDVEEGPAQPFGRNALSHHAGLTDDGELLQVETDDQEVAFERVEKVARREIAGLGASRQERPGLLGTSVPHPDARRRFRASEPGEDDASAFRQDLRVHVGHLPVVEIQRGERLGGSPGGDVDSAEPAALVAEDELSVVSPIGLIPRPGLGGDRQNGPALEVGPVEGAHAAAPEETTHLLSGETKG